MSEGLCTTGCPVKTPMPSTCIDEAVGRKVCQAAFEGVDVDENRYDACIRDVSLWRNVEASNDHRLSALDFELMANFSGIKDKYSKVSVKNVDKYQSLIKQDTQNCFANVYQKSKPSVSKCD